MPAQGQILGSRVDNVTQRVYMADVTSEGAICISGVVSINGFAGSITIGSVSANVDLGSVYILEAPPTSSNYNNPKWSLVYDSNGNLGSIYQMIGTGSYVNVVKWEGYSGLLPGVGSRITNISNWSVV